VGKPEQRKSPGRYGRRWKDTIEMDFKGRGLEGLDSLSSGQGPVNTNMTVEIS
jgi:hypothetical protein